MKKITIGLTKLFLINLLVLNVIVLDSPISNDTSSQDQIDTQLSMPFQLKYKKAHYKPTGELEGCWGTGSDCLVAALGGHALTFSDDGINFQ